MVNNPQLSDVELQVDSGDVYFAHSFMVYTRCPLLTEMVHESGFGVQEDNMPAARRVLMNDVPGPAVLALLQYLYTARCSIPPSLLPHVLELASRFDLQELRQLCVLQQEAAADEHEENFNNQTDEAFMELLCSMWNEEDEETDNDGGRDEERALKEDQHGNDLVSGDREMHDEKVNEEELEAIYEFAATQRKRKEEKDSGEEEEEWKIDEGEDREDLLSKLTEPKRGFNEKSLTVQSQLELDSNLRLSDPWRVDEEADPSSLPSASGPSKTHSPRSQQQQSSPKPSSELSGRTLLQSSASVVDDFSLRSPLSTSNLPIPGLSPGLVGDWGGGGDERTDKLDVPLKRESQGPNGICVSLSPDSPQNKKETEVIVLSDSSEEMEIVLSSRSPSPHSPCAVQCLKSCTQIKPQQPTSENKDCSPEVSWLIPSTPMQPGSSSRSSSTQTKNSMCRMQLFPKSGVSLPSSVFSSPVLSGNRPQTSTTPVQPGSSSRSSSTQTKNSMCRMQLFPKSEVSLPSSVFSSPELSGNRPQTSTSPTRVSAPAGPTEGSVSMVKLDRLVPCGSSLDLSLSPKRTSSYNASKAREVLALSKPKLSSTANSHPLQESSKQDTPLHLQLYSSTPLHTELHHPPFHLAASPLDTDLDKKKSTGGGKERKLSESSEKTELGNFHLSPLSDPSDPPSSFSHRGLQSLQRHSESRCSVESSRCDNTGTELKRGAEVESVGVRNETADLGDEGEQTDVADSSFRQSFIDEPPIAFSDSWGLDAHVEANPGCFSLRLEDSGGSNQQEHILGERTARLSPSTDCRPPPSSICNQSSNCHGSVINSSPAKAQSAQPPACVQVHAHSSFTPSPPGPTTCTPPDINNILMDTKIWDSWEEEEEEEEALPLFQRVNPSARLKTPMSSHKKNRQSLVPITPMPHYSDMDTPELKNKLNRFGVRPLPKRQMILKLKEIHQYTHQLVSSDSEDEAPSAGQAARTKPPPARSVAAGSRPVSCTQTVNFKKPSAPVAVSGEEGELLSASKGSDTSSTAASEESERSNSELCLSSDGDSDSNGGISASQAADRLKDRLQAVRSFILSDSGLYTQILQYQPLVLCQLQERLKAAGIRLGAAKLVDYLDSQCITFTTAKPGHSAPSRRWGKRKGKGAKAAGEKGKSRKKDIAAMI
uniref:Structure-specific endonuclease subunit SLX4 n=2 Tax=Monopterus albus TaxID=43700 RepID=A0A3Q3IDW8_MONAL